MMSTPPGDLKKWVMQNMSTHLQKEISKNDSNQAGMEQEKLGYAQDCVNAQIMKN